MHFTNCSLADLFIDMHYQIFVACNNQYAMSDVFKAHLFIKPAVNEWLLKSELRQANLPEILLLLLRSSCPSHAAPTLKNLSEIVCVSIPAPGVLESKNHINYNSMPAPSVHRSHHSLIKLYDLCLLPCIVKCNIAVKVDLHSIVAF